MTKVLRHEIGEARYSAGVDRGVFYPPLGPGVPWNGLVSVAEKPDETNTRITYMDGLKMTTELSLGTFSAEISAITYPPEFEGYDGYSEDHWDAQPRKPFNFAYRTLKANEISGIDLGYEIHLVYNVLASPTVREYKTVGTTQDPSAFDWSITTTPIILPDTRPASHLIIDSTMCYPAVLSALEDIVYGSSISDPRMPSIPEIRDLFELYAIFKVTDHGDGTATISGPDDAVFMTGVDTARFTYSSVVQLDEETYRLTSH